MINQFLLREKIIAKKEHEIEKANGNSGLVVCRYSGFWYM